MKVIYAIQYTNNTESIRQYTNENIEELKQKEWHKERINKHVYTFEYLPKLDILIVTDIYEYWNSFVYDSLILILGHEELYVYDMVKEKLTVFQTR